jgi:hypothetical protein
VRVDQAWPEPHAGPLQPASGGADDELAAGSHPPAEPGVGAYPHEAEPAEPPADREHLADWLTRFDPTAVGPVAFAMEGCSGWRYIPEEMANAGMTAHLAEPAETSALRGPKRRAAASSPPPRRCR